MKTRWEERKGEELGKKMQRCLPVLLLIASGAAVVWFVVPYTAVKILMVCVLMILIGIVCGFWLVEQWMRQQGE